MWASRTTYWLRIVLEVLSTFVSSRDTERSFYGGSGYRDGPPDVNELIAEAKRRVAEEKKIFATLNNVDTSSVEAKIGVCGELTQQGGNRLECYRYNGPVQYPAGQYCSLTGGLTPHVFAPIGGQLLMHGLEHNGIVSMLEAITAPFNNDDQNLVMNKSDTASACRVGNAIAEYSSSKPGRVYIRMVKAHLKKQEIVGMMGSHNSNCNEQRVARQLSWKNMISTYEGFVA